MLREEKRNEGLVENENGREEHNLEFGKLNCVVIRDDDREAMDGCVNVMFKQQR